MSLRWCKEGGRRKAERRTEGRRKSSFGVQRREEKEEGERKCRRTVRGALGNREVRAEGTGKV